MGAFQRWPLPPRLPRPQTWWVCFLSWFLVIAIAPCVHAGRAPPPGGWAAGVVRCAPSLHPNRAARGIRAPLSGDTGPRAQSHDRERCRVSPLVGRGDAPRVCAAHTPCQCSVSCSGCRFPHRLLLHAEIRAGERVLLRCDGGGEQLGSIVFAPCALRLRASTCPPLPFPAAQAGCDGRLLLEAQDPSTLASSVDALEGAFVRFAHDLTQQLASQLAPVRRPGPAAATAAGATSAARRGGEHMTASQAAAAAAATAASALSQATLTRVATKAVAELQRLTSEYRRGGLESRAAAAAAAPRLSKAQTQAQAASSSSSSTEASAPPASTAPAPAEDRQRIPIPATILCHKNDLVAELAILEPDIRAACGSQPSRRKPGAHLDYAGAMVLFRMVLRHVDPSIVVLPQDVPGSRHGTSEIAHFTLAFSAVSGSEATGIAGVAGSDPRHIVDAHWHTPQAAPGARRSDWPEQEPPALGLRDASIGAASRKLRLALPVPPVRVLAPTGMATDTRTPTDPASVRVTSDSNDGLNGACWHVGVPQHAATGTGSSTNSSAGSPTSSASATGTLQLGCASGVGVQVRVSQPAATLVPALSAATVSVPVPSPTTTSAQLGSGSSSPAKLCPVPVVPGATASAACRLSLSLSAALTASGDGTDEVSAHALAVSGPGRGSGALMPVGTDIIMMGMQTRSAAAKLRLGVGRSTGTLERDAHVPRNTQAGTLAGPDVICQWPVGSAGSGYAALLAQPAHCQALAFDTAHIRAQAAAAATAAAQARRRAPRAPAGATQASNTISSGSRHGGPLALEQAAVPVGPCVVMLGRHSGDSDPRSARARESESVPLPRPHWHSPALAASAGESESDSDSESDSLRVSISESRGAGATDSAKATDSNPLDRGCLSLPLSDAAVQWVHSLRVDAQLLLQGYLPQDDHGAGSIGVQDSIATVSAPGPGLRLGGALPVLEWQGRAHAAAGPVAASASVFPAMLHEGDEARPGPACGGASVLAGGMSVPVENGASIRLRLGPQDPSRLWQATPTSAALPGRDALLHWQVGASVPAPALAVPAASASHGATASLCEARGPPQAERRGDSEVKRAGEAAFHAATAASATASQCIVEIVFADDGEQSEDSHRDSESVRVLHQSMPLAALPAPMIPRSQSAAGAMQHEAMAVAQSGLGRGGGEWGGGRTMALATGPDSEAGRARVAPLMLPPHHDHGLSEAASSGDGGDAESDVGWELTT